MGWGPARPQFMAVGVTQGTKSAVHTTTTLFGVLRGEAGVR